jgi:hypothetical protein
MAWDGLFALQSQQPTRVSPPRQARVAETVQELRTCIEKLANGCTYLLWMPAMGWVLSPPPRRPAGARHSARIFRESHEQRILPEAMPVMVVLALVDNLNTVGADRLRACPLDTNGERCGRVFLAARRQSFCSRRHAQAAAWQTYVVKRKLRRR